MDNDEGCDRNYLVMCDLVSQNCVSQQFLLQKLLRDVTYTGQLFLVPRPRQPRLTGSSGKESSINLSEPIKYFVVVLHVPSYLLHHC